MLQRRHYKVIAEILKDSRTIITDDDDYIDLVYFWTTKLSRNNSKFDTDKFKQAVLGDE